MVRFVEENPQMQVALLAQHGSIYTGKVLDEEEGQQPIDLLGSKQDEKSAQRSLQVLKESLEQAIDFFEDGIHVALMGEVAIRR